MGPLSHTHTVDWRNPAPPGMCKNLVNNGIKYQPQLVIAGFLNHQQFHSHFRIPKDMGMVWEFPHTIFGASIFGEYILPSHQVIFGIKIMNQDPGSLLNKQHKHDLMDRLWVVSFRCSHGVTPYFVRCLADLKGLTLKGWIREMFWSRRFQHRLAWKFVFDAELFFQMGSWIVTEIWTKYDLVVIDLWPNIYLNCYTNIWLIQNSWDYRIIFVFGVFQILCRKDSSPKKIIALLGNTFLETNMSYPKALLKIIFLCPVWWEMNSFPGGYTPENWQSEPTNW